MNALQEELENILYEKESVCVSYASDSPSEDNITIDGTLKLVETSDAVYIVWTPRDANSRDDIPVHLRKPIEIDIRDLKSFKRAQPKIGWSYSYLIFILRDGTTHPPMEFRMGGTKALMEQMERYLSVKKSSKDSHVYLVRMFDQTALYKSFDELCLFDEDSRPSLAEQFVRDPKVSTFAFFSKVPALMRETFRGPTAIAGNVDVRYLANENTFGVPLHSMEDQGFEVLSLARTEPLCPRPTVVRGTPVTMEMWGRYLDPEGRVQCVDKLLDKIFKGGLEEDLRQTVWKYLLGYLKWDKTTVENEALKKQLEKQYYDMKFQWKSVTEDQERRFTLLKERKSLIDKDTHRTDRNNEFFKNKSDGNLDTLYDILMTYSMYNFDLGYVQGMNDLLAVILLIMKNETDAFWCFAGLMERMGDNFSRDQHGIKKQFSQLYCTLQALDPEFCCYIESQNSHEMFFCFRWLLVHFKREFSYKDTMRLWEVLWTNLPCYNFHLLIAAAILDTQKNTIIENKFGFNEILKHTNDLSGRIDLEPSLCKAEGMWEQLHASFDQLSDDVRDIFRYPSQHGRASPSC